MEHRFRRGALTLSAKGDITIGFDDDMMTVPKGDTVGEVEGRANTVLCVV